MKAAYKGIVFGLTSGVITTLGMMVGLSAESGSKIIVLGGVITIAIADAFSDALGIHISEESEISKSEKDVWVSTIATFFSKLFFASTFVIPVLLFELQEAVMIAIIWGLGVLSVLSYYIAKDRNENKMRVIIEHLAIAIIVIICVNFVGGLVAQIFR